jgi:hypothetical protein
MQTREVWSNVHKPSDKWHQTETEIPRGLKPNV